MSLRKKLDIGLIFLISLLGTGLFLLFQPPAKLSDFQYLEHFEPLKKENKSILKVTFFGVSTLLFDDGQEQILIDGFFSRPSLTDVMFTEINSNPKLLQYYIKKYELQRTQAILVTHSHYDHALDVAYLANSLKHVKVIGSKSTLNIARGGHVSETQLHQATLLKPVNIGQFTITAIPSQHPQTTLVNNDLTEEIIAPLALPTRFSNFKEGENFDYLIEYKGYKILVKASTGAIPHQYKDLKLDALFLGIAQLSRQTAEVQSEYLAETLLSLNPKLVIPIHWDDFFKPLNQPLEFLPRIADHAPQSLQRLADVAAHENIRVMLINKAQEFSLIDKPNQHDFAKMLNRKISSAP